MKERPILFSTAMVQAIMALRKTQTRRIVKPRTPEDFALLINMGAGVNVERAKAELIRCSCPYGYPGDLIWVRESWKLGHEVSKPYRFRADYTDVKQVDKLLKWRPSIHMPKAAARIWLKVVGVRIERLMDISESDAKAEGVKLSESGKKYLNYGYEKYKTTQFIYCEDQARNSFKSLWEVINGPATWRENPWVWVVEFEVLSTTGKQEVDHE